MDTYVKRLEDLQAIAESFTGVERSFAVQAGREVRILVRPEEIDDLTASRLARDIVKKIEEQLTYPGPDQGDGHPRDARRRVRQVARLLPQGTSEAVNEGGPMRRLTMLGLVLATAALIAACSSSGNALTGKTWQLTAITELVPAFQGVVPAADQPNYTIEFKTDGTYQAKADCNSTSGAYTTTSSGGLTILPGPTTLVACPEGSLSPPIPRGARQRRELRGRQQPADDHPQGRGDARLQVGPPAYPVRPATMRP